MTFLQIPEFETLDELYKNLIGVILREGKDVTARGMGTLEIYPTGFVLNNPRARCITNISRKWSFPLALGEFAWHMSGSNDVNFISHYAKLWGSFSEDGMTIQESCYGHKIFTAKAKGLTQWDQVIKILIEDPSSRRAVLSFVCESDEKLAHSKDVSCISTVQFVIRNGALDAITNMRSNDVILGLPYDVFFVTMLQEILSEILFVNLGKYYHFSNSMHLYSRHKKLAVSIINSEYLETFEMPKMENIEEIKGFVRLEKELRTSDKLFHESDITLNNYWKDLFLVLIDFHNRRMFPEQKSSISLKYKF